MHEQIRTSPGSTEENIRRVADVLADAGINVEGIGPDFESPHVRIHIDHGDGDDGPILDAMAALQAAGLQPARCQAVTAEMPNMPGAIRAAMKTLVRKGFEIESVLVLATHGAGDAVRVSFGVRRRIEADWESISRDLAHDLVAD